MGNVFMRSIASNFDKIKKRFKDNIRANGYQFDEDVFMSTIIKCNEKIDEGKMTDIQMVKYLWIAFKNNTLRELNYFRNNSTNVFPENILEEPEDKTLFYNVAEIIVQNFGEELYRLFVLHANGASYEDLSTISNIPDIKYQFRKIREFVREKFKGEV